MPGRLVRLDWPFIEATMTNCSTVDWRLCVMMTLGLGTSLLPVITGEAAPGQAAAKSRTYRFTYDATLKNVPAGKTARVWIPLAQSGLDQDVAIVATTLPEGARHRVGTEKQYGNKMLYVEARANDGGTIPIQVVFRVTRREVLTKGPQAALIKPAADEPIARFLEPDARVPVGGKPLMLLKDRKVPADPYQAAKLLYDVVNAHMTYSKKGTGWGRGDSVWACDSRYGNCTDFHSLFISLARAERIPAKFVMGFAIPAKRGAGDVGGYHCWAWFLPADKGWIPVDISEANQHPKFQVYCFGNLTEDRVQFTTGRDITLVPRQSGEPLNFFIYPYVEVDGRHLAADQVTRHFSYRDEAPAE
jgi:hypothetical protein